MTQYKEILLVISKFPPEYAGPGVRIPRLYEALKLQNKPYSLRVLCNGVEETRGKKYKHKGVSVHRVVARWAHALFSYMPIIPDRVKHSVIYQLEFIQTILIFSMTKTYSNIDMFHIAGHSGGTAAALVWAKVKGIPVVMELVTANAPYRQKFFFIFRTPCLKELKVVALTHDMERKCLQSGVSPDRLWCRPNPIAEDKFSFPSLDQKQGLRVRISPFSHDNVVLVSVAKMMPQKNQKLIIETLRYLPSNFVALIGGPLVEDGPLYARDLAYVKEMEALIARYGLENRIHWVKGFVDAADYIKSGDIYMMPAWNEGFGTPMLEAMGCGLPVVGNKDEPAFQEWIVNNKNGCLCDIGNPQNWAKAVEDLSLLSEKERLHISKITHKNAGQRTIYAHYEEIITQLITEKNIHESRTKN